MDKHDLALINLQMLICHKTNQPIKLPTEMLGMNFDKVFLFFFSMIKIETLIPCNYFRFKMSHWNINKIFIVTFSYYFRQK